MVQGNGGTGSLSAKKPALWLLFQIFLIISLMTIGLSGSSKGESAYTGGGYLTSRISSADDSIWRMSSDNAPDNTTVTIAVSGTGTKGITLAPQDVVFIMDHSGSLQTYDPLVMRILGAHEYVDSMIAPFDRAAIVKFDSTAILVNNDHLSSNYPQVHANLELLERTQPQGQTNFKAALDVVINEFSTFGSADNQKIAVLFTDGVPDPPETNVTLPQMDDLVLRGIRVFTIGLGPAVDESLLTWMAERTNGSYFHAQTPEELVNIYLKISDQFYDQTAGRNATLDAFLSDDFTFLEGSQNITDGFALNVSGGRTVLSWSLPRLMIGGNWSVTFRIGSPEGEGRTKVLTSESMISYRDWRGNNKTSELPDLYITIIRSLPPPLPPPPPPPLPISPAPIPPPPSVPVIAPSVNVAPVITATPNITPITIGQTATVPVEYMLAGLAALGIASRTAIRKKIVQKQKVSVGA